MNSIQNRILTDSRITPSGNGSSPTSSPTPPSNLSPTDPSSLNPVNPDFSDIKNSIPPSPSPKENTYFCVPPTNGQKWWAALLLGFVFAIVSSPAAYYATSYVTTSLGGISLTVGPGPNLVGLLIHTLIFILIVRIILW